MSIRNARWPAESVALSLWLDTDARRVDPPQLDDVGWDGIGWDCVSNG